MLYHDVTKSITRLEAMLGLRRVWSAPVHFWHGTSTTATTTTTNTGQWGVEGFYS